MNAYYLPQYSFSVRMQGGAWVLCCRNASDAIATTPELVAAVESWATRNRQKYAQLAD